MQRSLFRIAIFASGAGSNAEKMIRHFEHHHFIKIALVVCNKSGAGVLDIATKYHVPVLLVERETFFRGDAYVTALRELEIDLVVLAGFLWKIPGLLIDAFPQRIINIHPALLPKYGGKGMYGNHVHEAVIANHERESGITIHFVDGHYDNGDIIMQAKCPVLHADTAHTLAARIHALEHEHYPATIEKLILENSALQR